MNNQMKKDRIAGAVLAAAGGLAAVGTKLMKVKMRLSVCGAGILFSKVPDKKMLTLDRGQWGKFGFLFLVLICYLLGLKYLGFLVSTPLAAFALIYILKQKKKINLAVAAAYSLILTGVLYLVFVKLLSIVLP